MNIGRIETGKDAHNFAKVGKGSAVLAGWWRFAWRWESRGTTLGQSGGFRAGAHTLNIAELEAWAAETATGETMGTMGAEAGCRSSGNWKGWSFRDVHSYETVYGCIDVAGGAVAGTMEDLGRRASGEWGVYESYEHKSGENRVSDGVSDERTGRILISGSGQREVRGTYSGHLCLETGWNTCGSGCVHARDIGRWRATGGCRGRGRGRAAHRGERRVGRVHRERG